jgi:hypothetical protein
MRRLFPPPLPQQALVDGPLGVTNTVIPGDDVAVRPDEVSKCVATALARLALQGIEAHPAGQRAWLMRYSDGTLIGAVQGDAALIEASGGVLPSGSGRLSLSPRRLGGSHG